MNRSKYQTDTISFSKKTLLLIFFAFILISIIFTSSSVYVSDLLQTSNESHKTNLTGRDKLCQHENKSIKKYKFFTFLKKKLQIYEKN